MPIVALFGALVLSGCNDSDKAPKLDLEPVARAVAITGAVVADNVSNADVAVHLINSDGTLVITVITNADFAEDGKADAQLRQVQADGTHTAIWNYDASQGYNNTGLADLVYHNSLIYTLMYKVTEQMGLDGGGFGTALIVSIDPSSGAMNEVLVSEETDPETGLSRAITGFTFDANGTLYYTTN
ncbi:MAG: hypothetical protein VX171_02365, partial [Pseudomonadota bacterium]|nr:hypothetical protein [Pseudomonadota bacterium]